MAASRSADLVTKQIFDLYRRHGDSDYIGEPVSQQQHMIQCAMLAEKECYSDEVILGAFLHDIGHLLGLENSLPSMGTFGTHQHEITGEQFLKDLGFPDSVTSFVRGHVDTKRYLVFKNSSYFEELSPASKETLRHQGGPMTAEEAVCFEKLKHFQALVKMRTWDDLAKVANAPVEGLEKYEHMCRNYLESVYSNKTQR